MPLNILPAILISAYFSVNNSIDYCIIIEIRVIRGLTCRTNYSKILFNSKCGGKHCRMLDEGPRLLSRIQHI